MDSHCCCADLPDYCYGGATFGPPAASATVFCANSCRYWRSAWRLCTRHSIGAWRGGLLGVGRRSDSYTNYHHDRGLACDALGSEPSPTWCRDREPCTVRGRYDIEL